MAWQIKSMEEKYLLPAAQLVQQVFTDYGSPEEGKLVRSLVEEIRSMDSYIPELELIMVDSGDDPIGYVMFSRFHLQGRYGDRLLLLTPAAVQTRYQRQHISKQLIEYGFQRARELGFEAVIVEGNPQNYRSRGFATSSDFGILPSEKLKLPAIECLMVKELVPGALASIRGLVDYSDYKNLT